MMEAFGDVQLRVGGNWEVTQAVLLESYIIYQSVITELLIYSVCLRLSQILS